MCGSNAPRSRISPLNFPDFVAVREAVVDAVDGSSTRHVSGMDLGAVKASTIWRSYLSVVR